MLEENFFGLLHSSTVGCLLSAVRVRSLLQARHARAGVKGLVLEEACVQTAGWQQEDMERKRVGENQKLTGQSCKGEETGNTERSREKYLLNIK